MFFLQTLKKSIKIKLSHLLQQALHPFTLTLAKLIEEKLNFLNTQKIPPISTEKTTNLTDINSLLDLNDLLKEVNAKKNLWLECDVILTSFLTTRAAKIFFPNIPIIEINSPEAFYTILSSWEKRFNNIGIMSVKILEFLMESSELMMVFTQQCAQHCLFIHNAARPSYITYAKQLHKAGFYEITHVDHNKTAEFTTINLYANGDFIFYGTTPGIIFNETWNTHIAYRMCSLKPILPWQNRFDMLHRDNELGYFVKNNHFALPIKTLDDNPDQVLYVHAHARWKTLKEGHASLITCYSGPGDSNMYALLLKLLTETTVQVSLWRSSPEWNCLTETIYSNIDATNQYFSVKMWMNVTATHIRGGLNDDVLIHVKDEILPRTANVGWRIHSDAIHLDNLEIITDQVVLTKLNAEQPDLRPGRTKKSKKKRSIHASM